MAVVNHDLFRSSPPRGSVGVRIAHDWVGTAVLLLPLIQPNMLLPAEVVAAGASTGVRGAWVSRGSSNKLLR